MGCHAVHLSVMEKPCTGEEWWPMAAADDLYTTFIINFRPLLQGDCRNLLKPNVLVETWGSLSCAS
jgi:hypothetical protein